VSALLAAPLILSLLRFGDLYYFVHYSGYADVGAYLESSVRATGGPVFIAGVVGLVVPWLEGERPLSRAVSATAVTYVFATAFLALSPWPSSLIDQLEATRLMPFQRLLWFWLAAIALDAGLRFTLRGASRWTQRAGLDGALLLVAAAFPVLYVIAPPAFVPEGDRGLVVMPGSAQPGIVDLEAAVRAADGAAADGTALLVLGTSLSWHDQLWGPLWSDRPFFYDDWLWYWHRDHAGAYDPEAGHAYPDDASALRPEYLETHGIGAVVVTGSASEVAAMSASLEPVRDGIWDVYRVRDPVGIVTFDGANANVTKVGNQRFAAAGEGSEIVVRRNWFPRWQASVDGVAIAVERTNDGYMRVVVPDGVHDLELTYRVVALDWLGRLCAVLGMLVATLLIGPARLRPWERKRRHSVSEGGVSSIRAVG
jgi:hypothetical protein